MQVRYDPTADRVLWQLRTPGGELFALWLTRRMLRQLWPHLTRLVALAGLAGAGQDAVLLPEARQMLADAARSRSLAGADFATPFNPTAVALPLGPLPLLPVAIDLGPGRQGQGLALAAREADGRHIRLELSADLATGLLRLLEQALAGSGWGILAPPADSADPADPAEPPSPARPIVLN